MHFARICSYYASIMLDTFLYLLCSKLCWYNWCRPTAAFALYLLMSQEVNNCTFYSIRPIVAMFIAIQICHSPPKMPLSTYFDHCQLQSERQYVRRSWQIVMIAEAEQEELMILHLKLHKVLLLAHIRGSQRI